MHHNRGVDAVLDVDISEQHSADEGVGELHEAPSVEVHETEYHRGDHQEHQGDLAHAETSQDVLGPPLMLYHADDEHRQTDAEGPGDELLLGSGADHERHHGIGAVLAEEALADRLPHQIGYAYHDEGGQRGDGHQDARLAQRGPH